MPNRSAGLQTRGAIRGGSSESDFIFFTLRANGKCLKFSFFVISVYYKKLGRCLKLLVPKYHPDPLNGLGDIPEKVYSAELKPIVKLRDAHSS